MLRLVNSCCFNLKQANGVFMEEEKTNKCAHCGGQMVFDSQSQSLKCIHCGALDVFDVERMTQAKHPFDGTSESTTSKTENAEYACMTCGRRHVFKKGEKDIRCPSCGDKNLKRVLKIDYKPDGILPFKVDKDNALKCFFEWIKKRKMAPRALKNLDRAQLLKAMYVPMYSFDTDTFTKYTGIGIDRYTDSKGKKRVRRETFSSSCKNQYRDYYESAGEEISTETLVKLRPFSNELYVYKPEFVYGYIGAELTCHLQDSFRFMALDITQSIERKIRRELGYTEIQAFKCATSFSNTKYHYYYLPVYKGTYHYGKKDYTFYVNGESGKVVGKAPVSIWKAIGVALLIGLGIAGIALLITFLSK